MSREKIIQLAEKIKRNNDMFGNFSVALYHAAQAEAFEAVIENLNPKHFVTGAMYQSTIAAIREMAKEMK